MNNAFDKLELARWKIIINVNPTEGEAENKRVNKKYYAELAKVDYLGRIYGTMHYEYYKSHQEALDTMLEFAEKNGIKVDESEDKNKNKSNFVVFKPINNFNLNFKEAYTLAFYHTAQKYFMTCRTWYENNLPYILMLDDNNTLCLYEVCYCDNGLVANHQIKYQITKEDDDTDWIVREYNAGCFKELFDVYNKIEL